MICGVVAEFNPFHYGHKYQLDELKKRLNPELVIALISGDYVQRGEVSIINMWDKTKIALEMGYDIVLMIPPHISIQNAEVYCSVSTRILDSIGVDVQVFGAEIDDINSLLDMKSILKSDNILEYTSKGMSYNKACSMVLGDKSNLFTSNNILAMEYLNTMKEYNLKIKPYIIKRNSVGYNEEKIIGRITSATNIRNMLKRGEYISEYIPYSTKVSYNLNWEDKLFKLFKYIFLTTDTTEIYDLNLELRNYLQNRLKDIYTYDKYLTKCLSKNTSLNRLKRVMLNTVLNIKSSEVNKDFDIQNVIVLGSNSKGGKFVSNNPKLVVNETMKIDNRYMLLYDYLGYSYRFKHSIYEE